MKKLKRKWFLGTRDNPQMASDNCLDYINFKGIKQEDIQQITHDNFSVILYFWVAEGEA